MSMAAPLSSTLTLAGVSQVLATITAKQIWLLFQKLDSLISMNVG